MGCACGKKKKSKNEIVCNLKEGMIVSDDRFEVNLKETLIDIRKKIFKQTGQSTFNKKILLGGISIDENKQIGTTATGFRNGSTIMLVSRDQQPNLNIRLKHGDNFLQDKAIYGFTYMFHIKELISIQDKLSYAKLKLIYEENELDDLTTAENIKLEENSIIEIKSF